MSIIGNAIGGAGGAKLNIDFGATPPSDHTKLWVPMSERPGQISIGWQAKYGNPVLGTEPYGYAKEHLSGCCSAANGKLYEFTGGDNYYKCYEINPQTDAVTELSSGILPGGATHICCTTIGNRIYFFGKNSGSTQPSPVRVFNPADGTSANLSADLGVNVTGACCAVVGDKAYIVMRGTPQYIRIFNASAGTLAISSAQLPQYLSFPCCAAVGTKVYIFGGQYYNARSTLIKNRSIYVFDTVSNAITTLGTQLPIDAIYAGCCAVGDTIYIFAGNSIAIFDTVSQTCTLSPTNFPVSVSFPGCTVMGQTIYITYGNSVYTASVDMALPAGELYIQTDVLTNAIALIKTPKTNVIASVCGCWIGDSGGVARQTDGYYYSNSLATWRKLDGTSVTADMLNALATMGVT